MFDYPSLIGAAIGGLIGGAVVACLSYRRGVMVGALRRRHDRAGELKAAARFEDVNKE